MTTRLATTALLPAELIFLPKREPGPDAKWGVGPWGVTRGMQEKDNQRERRWKKLQAGASDAKSRARRRAQATRAAAEDALAWHADEGWLAEEAASWTDAGWLAEEA